MPSHKVLSFLLSELLERPLRPAPIHATSVPVLAHMHETIRQLVNGA